MKKVKILSLILCLSIMLVSVPAYAANNTIDINKTHKITANEYVQWLETEKVGEKQEEINDINKTISEFNALSKSDKEKFLNYITDEKLINSIMTFLLSSNNENINLFNGDIVINKNIEAKEENVMVTTDETIYTTTSPFSANAEVLGIEVYRQTSVINYKHTSSEILQINYSDHYVSKCFVIGVDVSISSENQWISGNRAYASAIFSWNFIYEGLGILIGAHKATVWGGTTPATGGGWLTRLS